MPLDSLRNLAFLNRLHFDPATSTVTIDGSLSVKITGDIYFKSDKHICVNSGGHPDPRRSDGVHLGIFLNSDIDQGGQPVVRTPLNDPPNKFKPWINRKPKLKKKPKFSGGCGGCGGDCGGCH